MSDGHAHGDTAVLVMAYGGPDCLDAVGPFMCALIGREPSAEVLERVQARYECIGGKSPLPQIASEFATALEMRFAQSGSPVPAVVGFKYTSPKIGDVLRDLYSRGIRSVVAVSLSPFESNSTSTAYQGAANEALAGLDGMEVTFAPAFSSLDAFSGLHAESLASALSTIDVEDCETLTVFTAHSLPVADLETPELYVSGLRSVASSIASGMGWKPGAEFADGDRMPGISAWGSPESDHPWMVAYQSKGMRPGQWLGPDLGDVMQVAAQNGFKAVVVSPIGFATEHMETKYDLDVVEAQHAEELGLTFARGTAPNAAPRLIEAVFSIVARLIEDRQ